MKKNRTLAIFDFDGTITSKDSVNHFLIWRHGLARVSLFYFLISPFVALYLIKLISNDFIKKLQIFFFLKGDDFSNFIDDCNNYADLELHKIIRMSAIDSIKYHSDQNHKLIIISASFSYWIERWAAQHNFDYIVGTQVNVKNGVVRGLFGTVPFGKKKVDLLGIVFPKYSEYIIYSYGDSFGDKEMLDIASYPMYRTFNLTGKDRKLVNNPPNAALVSDGEWRKSLSVVRSLGKSDISVGVIGDSIFTLSFWSKYTKKRLYSTCASNNHERFKNNLLSILLNKYPNNKPVFFPMEDETINWLSDNAVLMEQYCNFLIPPSKSLDIAQDKFKTMKFANDIEISTPNTYFFKSAHELKLYISSYSEKLNIALHLIKPTSGSGSSGVVYSNDILKLDINKHWIHYGPLLLQELIPLKGKIIGVSVLMSRNCIPIATFAHERLFQYPVTGGPSTDRVGIYNKYLVDESVRLLTELKWSGVAMVEWKYDISTGEYKLLEINPRFWGSLELSVRSGVDFPYLYYLASLGVEINRNHKYLSGVRCRWLMPGDILSYARDPNRRKSLLTFVRGLPGEAEEWDSSDIQGMISTIACYSVNALNPKYWRYLRNKR